MTKQDTIKAINRLIADITNDPDKSEERLVAQLGTFQQGIADLDDYNITLFKKAAYQVYSLQMYQLLSVNRDY